MFGYGSAPETWSSKPGELGTYHNLNIDILCILSILSCRLFDLTFAGVGWDRPARLLDGSSWRLPLYYGQVVRSEHATR